jgi:hypothetical protein
MRSATSLSDAGGLWQLRRASRLSPFAEAHVEMNMWGQPPQPSVERSSTVSGQQTET